MSNNKNEKAESSEKSIHIGHRQRIINKYIEYGLSSFSEHEVLELLLFFSIPRSDTNPLAHKILDEFGSLDNVFNSSADDLLSIDGVGNNTAVLLSLFRAVREYQSTHLTHKKLMLNSGNKICRFCLEYFKEHINEEAIILALDNKFCLKKVSVVSSGTSTQTSFYADKILKTALNLRAPVIVLAHNHPGGTPNPSVADKALTLRLCDILGSVQVELYDHVICNEKEYISMRECGMINKTERNDF